MKILITGITGMVGSHLAEYLLSSFPEVEVHGLVRWRSPLGNIKGVLPRIRLHQGDLRDLNSLVRVVCDILPDRIHHLAAQSYVDMSFVAPADTLHSNIIGTCNLLDAVRIAGINPRIHICSSSEVYGQVGPDEVPISEQTPLRPASPYAVSKVGEDQLFYLMARGLTEQAATAMIVNGFIEPVVKTLPMEYAIELSRLIELSMEGAVG